MILEIDDNLCGKELRSEIFRQLYLIASNKFSRKDHIANWMGCSKKTIQNYRNKDNKLPSDLEKEIESQIKNLSGYKHSDKKMNYLAHWKYKFIKAIK